MYTNMPIPTHPSAGATGPGAARRGATAAAVGRGAVRRGVWGARTALGHRRRRGARGGGEGRGGGGMLSTMNLENIQKKKRK